MSRFIFMDADDIAEEHYTRATEILGTYLNRDDAEIEDLIMMIAEALQSLDNREDPIDLTPEDGPDIEVTSSNIKNS